MRRFHAFFFKLCFFFFFRSLKLFASSACALQWVHPRSWLHTVNSAPFCVAWQFLDGKGVHYQAWIDTLQPIRMQHSTRPRIGVLPSPSSSYLNWPYRCIQREKVDEAGARQLFLNWMILNWIIVMRVFLVLMYSVEKWRTCTQFKV